MISEQDKEKYTAILTAQYMSSEESMTDDSDNEEQDQEKKKMFARKTLPWRSDEVDDMFKSLDRKAARRRSERAAAMVVKRRVTVNASVRLAPPDAPRWAIRP